MEIGDRIRELRLNAGYTQYVVAKFVYIEQKSLSDYELGKIVIPVPNLIKIAELFDVSMDYICCLTDIPSPYPAERDLSTFDPEAVEWQKYI